MKSLNAAPGVLQKTQITRYAAEHAVVRVPVPKANTKSQGPRIVVGRVAALAPRKTVDGMLNQPRRVRHTVQVIQHNRIANGHYTPPCISFAGRSWPPGVANPMRRTRSGTFDICRRNLAEDLQVLADPHSARTSAWRIRRPGVSFRLGTPRHSGIAASHRREHRFSQRARSGRGPSARTSSA